MISTIEELDKLIKTCRSPQELFGDDIDATLKKYLILTHPDRNIGDDLAEKLYKRVQELAEEAKKPQPIVKSPKRQYQLLKLLEVGDVSDVYLATSERKDYVVKISRVKGGDTLLDREREAVASVLKSAGDEHYRKYFPTLVESFPAKGRFQRRVNVFVYEPGFYTLKQIRQKYPQGLDGRHLAWIFKRLLTALGFIHQAGWIHGAILPCHIQIHAENHGAQLLGWTHAIQKGNIKTISTKYKEWYPPEVLNKQEASSATDIYLTAKCMVYLAGGQPLTKEMPDTVPVHTQNFIRSCLLDGQKMRPNDAWELLEDFDKLLRSLYGKSKFVHLTM